MDFPNYASSEISAALGHLLSRQSGATLHQLNAVREALDLAARALATPAETDNDVQELVGRVTAAADAEIRRIRQDAHAAREDAHGAIVTSRNEVRAHIAEQEKLGAALARNEAETALLRNELRTAQERVQAAEQDLAITIEAHADLEAQLQMLRAESTAAAAARGRVEQDLSQAHATIEQLLADVEELRGRVDREAMENGALHTQLSEARDVRQHRDALAAQVESAQARIQSLEKHLADAHAISEYREQLAGELQSATRRIQELERELGSAHQTHEERERLALQLDTTERRLHDLESQLADARQTRDHRDHLAAQLDTTIRRIQELEGELATARRAHDQHHDQAIQLDAMHRRVHDLESDLSDARRISDERTAGVPRLETSSGRVQQLEAANTHQLDQIRDLTARLDAALQSEIRLQEKLAARPVEAPASDDTDLEIMRAEVDRMVALLDASARAVTEMAAAANANDLLTELLKRLSLQFSRVALFRIKGNRLEGEQQVGFEDATAITKLTFPLSAQSILARAVNSRGIESVTGPDALSRTGLPFGGAPTAAVAAPIVLQGETVAVVYGDDADMPDWARGPAVHDSSVGFARLLVGQVSVLLMRHTQEMKTLAELRQYATTLLQEAKDMYLTDAQTGKPSDVLRSRLKDNLECASQLYAYRAAMEGTAAAALLDDQIVAELEESTPFARDLASVVAEMAAGELQITAEAS